MPTLAECAGIERRVIHTRCVTRARPELAEAGVPINVIQAALGHSSLATTDRYLAHVAPEQVLDSMAAGWRLAG